VLRQVEHYRDSGRFLTYDPLSFAGSQKVISPAYYVLLGWLSRFLGEEWLLKVLPNLLAVSLIPLIFLIAMRITKIRTAALTASFVAAFVPVLFEKTFNSLTTLALALPLLFAALYIFLNIRKRNMIYYYIIVLVILCLTSPLVFFLIFAYLLYFLMIKVENIQAIKQEKEVFIFTFFLTLWTQFIIYKKAFITLGPMIVWQNIPWSILNQYFQRVSIIDMMYQVGPVPLLFGFYIIYRFAFREKDRGVYLFISFAFLSILLLTLRLLSPPVGLMILGLVMAILLGKYIEILLRYMEYTKFARWKRAILLVVLVLIILTSVIPSVSYALFLSKTKIQPYESDALKFIRENTPQDAVILASPEEGPLITYFANRSNVVDLDFLLVPDVNTRWRELQNM
jgi:hypothetical protein